MWLTGCLVLKMYLCYLPFIAEAIIYNFHYKGDFFHLSEYIHHGRRVSCNNNNDWNIRVDNTDNLPENSAEKIVPCFLCNKIVLWRRRQVQR